MILAPQSWSESTPSTHAPGVASWFRSLSTRRTVAPHGVDQVKKHFQKRMARFVKLPYIVLQCMQKYCFVLFCWMCIRPPQIHELLTKLTNLVSCPRLVHGQQKQTKLPNQTNKRNGFPLTGSCMGSKRGSAGLESVAGEGVGEEEFLARFNRKSIFTSHCKHPGAWSCRIEIPRRSLNSRQCFTEMQNQQQQPLE